MDAPTASRDCALVSSLPHTWNTLVPMDPDPPPQTHRPPPFLSKLRRLVDDCPATVGSWAADGARFDVHDPEAFAALVCGVFAPSHAEESKGRKTAMKTFSRQLQFYAFKKSNQRRRRDGDVDDVDEEDDVLGDDEATSNAGTERASWSFWHPHFLRDDPGGIARIRRFSRVAQRDENEASPPLHMTTIPNQHSPKAVAKKGSSPAAPGTVTELRKRVALLESTVEELTQRLARAEARNREHDDATGLLPLMDADPRLEEDGDDEATKMEMDVDMDVLPSPEAGSMMVSDDDLGFKATMADALDRLDEDEVMLLEPAYVGAPRSPMPSSLSLPADSPLDYRQHHLQQQQHQQSVADSVVSHRKAASHFKPWPAQPSVQKPRRRMDSMEEPPPRVETVA